MNETTDIVEHGTTLGFSETVERLTRAIEAAGMAVFARVDHAAAAAAVGLALPPTLVLIYGNARGGTPIMRDHPRAALDLPLRVLVREGDDGSVRVSFHPIVPVLVRDGVAPAAAHRLEPGQELLLAAIR